MYDEIVVNVNGDGNLQLLHTGLIDYEAYGGNDAVSITRASNVEFNNDTKEWEVEIIETGELHTGFKNRKEALTFEVDLLQSRM